MFAKTPTRELVIVHGAGSFGHMKAKEFRLAEGRVAGISQDEAVAEVRNDMLELNQKVVSSLQSRGLDVHHFLLISGLREQVQIFLENSRFTRVLLLFSVMLLMMIQMISEYFRETI